MAVKAYNAKQWELPLLMEGRRTMARLICKDGNDYCVPDMDFFDAKKRTYAVHNFADTEHEQKLCIVERPCPICPGDILWVRETWRVGAWDVQNQMIAFDYKDATCGPLVYINDRVMFERLIENSREDARRAGCTYNGTDFIWKKGTSPCRWHPSIHMPKEAARIWLKVTDVRVEQLQNMTYKEAIKEGIDPCLCINLKHTVFKYFRIWDYSIKKSYIYLYGWKANPWVWVIEFERCEKPNGIE